ncbi:thermonuclease family protein [Paracoccus contaminans]|nr:thermonuclease family protein [Paracoccus contaminans]
MAFLMGVLMVVALLVMPSRKRRRKGTRLADRRKPDIKKRPVSPRPQPASHRPPGAAIIAGPAFVVDGDTITIRKKSIRLFGIDAPELNHPYGRNARGVLIGLCQRQTIRAEILCSDDHGRLVARCTLRDGRDLSAEMVKQGLALDWSKFSGGCYRHLETADARKHLWLADARQKGRMHVWESYAARSADKR